MKADMKPKDAQVLFDGLYYKIGLHGAAYRHTGQEWVRSSKTAAEVQNEIEKQKRARG